MLHQQSWHIQTLGIYSKKNLKMEILSAVVDGRKCKVFFFGSPPAPPSLVSETQREVSMIWVFFRFHSADYRSKHHCNF